MLPEPLSALTMPQMAGGHPNSPPVMLAMSTRGWSAAAVELALEKARGRADLVLAFVADSTPPFFLTGTDLGLNTDLSARWNQNSVCNGEKIAHEAAREIGQYALRDGTQTRLYMAAGNFVAECVQIAAKERPSTIVVTRQYRPLWWRRLVGGPSEVLSHEAGCKVLEA